MNRDYTFTRVIVFFIPFVAVDVESVEFLSQLIHVVSCLCQAKAEQREKEQELQDMNVLLQSVQMERDQAVKVRIHISSTTINR